MPTEHLNTPHSPDAERAVLGAILKDPEALSAVLEVGLKAACFYDKKHVDIFMACVDLYEESRPVDITTVAGFGIPGTVLVEIAECVASTANVAAHAKIVLDKYVLRSLISTTNTINRECYGSEDVATILDGAESKIFRIAESQIKQGFELADTKPVIERIERIASGEQEPGLMTGFTALDKLTMGLHGGDLTIIAARPSMGKTALAINIAEYIAGNGTGVGIFSLEMSRDQLVGRMISGQARVDQQVMREGTLTQGEFDRTKMVDVGNIFIDDSCALTALEMRAKARRLCAGNDIGVIIIDYLQLMTSSGENRQQEMTAISRSVKSLARELMVPVVALSQLSRQVENRSTRMPQLSDLRESGAIEQDADVVAFVHRAEYYWSKDERDIDAARPSHLKEGGRADIIVAKQRNGPTGTVELAFVGKYARFENLTCQEIPDGVL